MQVSSCIFDVVILVLAGATFRGDDGAAVRFAEIAKGKFVVLFRFGIFLVVDSEMPFRVFMESVEPDKFVFLLSRRLVFTPIVPFIKHHLPLLDEVLCVLETAFV